MPHHKQQLHERPVNNNYVVAVHYSTGRPTSHDAADLAVLKFAVDDDCLNMGLQLQNASFQMHAHVSYNL